MKFPAYFLAALCIIAIAAPARAADSAVATCGPNDGYVTLYISIDSFEMAARLPCGTQLDLVEAQKSYAAQHTPYLRVATEDGKEGYVARTAITIVHNAPQMVRAAAAKVAPTPAAPVTPAVIPSEVRVLDGTELEVKLSADLSSDRTAEGSIVNLEVAEPLVINGVTVFQRGAPAHARIIQVKKAARWGHDGEIYWTMQDVTAADGTRLTARFVAESQNTTGAPAGIVAATGNALLVEQSAFSLHKGDDAFVPAGQIFKVFLHGDSVIRTTH